MLFDLSLTNILLMAAVVALFIVFITVLMKLNPSTEKKENFETQIKVESKKLLPTSPIAPRNPPPPTKTDVPRVTEKPLLAISPTIGGSSTQAKQETPAPTSSESREISKQAKTEPVSSKRDCLHQFGYLRTFPKNSPIPDECFGCPKIVECLINNTKNSKRRS
jgi:hypothetical protein